MITLEWLWMGTISHKARTQHHDHNEPPRKWWGWQSGWMFLMMYVSRIPCDIKLQVPVLLAKFARPNSISEEW